MKYRFLLLTLSAVEGLLLISRPLAAWDEIDHQAMGLIALEEVSAGWGLDQPVPVRPLQSFLNKLPPPLQDSWHFSEWLKINPAVNLEKVRPELAGKKLVTPAEILSVYSVDPDDGRDQNIFVRDKNGNPRYRFPDQKWFGRVSGPDSQAFRHIEKPPFHWRHPIATFGLPFRAVGEATGRAEIWYLLSQLAFAVHEEYWGWRFLANSFHYLQDLTNPYHAGQITPELVLKGFIAYLRGGKMSLMETYADLISHSHRFFEHTIATIENRDQKQILLSALKGEDFVDSNESVNQMAKRVRDKSNLLFPRLIRLALAPLNDQLFDIARGRFGEAGKVLRSVTFKALEERTHRAAEQTFGALSALLGNPVMLEDH